MSRAEAKSLHDLDMDELVERLTPGEIERLLDECDPDDPTIPPSMRSNYKCSKQPTGQFNRDKLMEFITEQVTGVTTEGVRAAAEQHSLKGSQHS